MSLKNLKQVDALIGCLLIQKIQGAQILDGLSLLCKDSQRLFRQLVTQFCGAKCFVAQYLLSHKLSTGCYSSGRLNLPVFLSIIDRKICV